MVDGLATMSKMKKIIHDHFASVIGKTTRTKNFNWDGLHFANVAMEDIDAPFLEEEIQKAINEMPFDKAPLCEYYLSGNQH
jgi:hypothetical protein